MTPRFLPAASGRAAALLCLCALLPALLGGCGSAGGSKDYARIRVADAAVNALTANVLVNGSSANGDLQQGAVSPYLYIGTGTSSFSYSTTTAIASGATPPAGPSLNLANGQFYTAFLIGRSDVPVRSTAYTGTTDPRFLQVIVANDARPSSTSGQALVRVIDAAPDAGSVDVLANGALPDAAFGGIAYREVTTTFVSAPYVNIPAGSVSVQVNTNGTSTAVFPAQTLSLASGAAYTLILQQVTAPTTSSTGVVTPPTYTLKLVSDNG